MVASTRVPGRSFSTLRTKYRSRITAPTAVSLQLDFVLRSMWLLFCYTQATLILSRMFTAGVFMLSFAIAIARGQVFRFTQADMPVIRRRFAADLATWGARRAALAAP